MSLGRKNKKWENVKGKEKRKEINGKLKLKG
jgi:hypothetical protein